MKNKGVKCGQVVIHITMILCCFAVIIPLALVFVVSFSTELSVLRKGYTFFPEGFSLNAYRLLFSNNQIFNAYGISILVTAAGTFLSVLFMSMCAYTLSCGNCKHKNKLAMFLYLPTLINPGLVPWYINISHTLGLSNTILVLFLPVLIGPFNIFLIRNYFKSIPDSLVESARMDGAGHYRVYFRIMLPLSVPIIATIALLTSLGFWNNWYMAAWFIDNPKLYPLQYFLYRLESQFSSFNPGQSGGILPEQTFYVATMFVTIGPIVLIYPFVQRYFIKGIMIGAVKG